MRAAYQGAPGAFGHEAALTFLPDCEPVAKLDFAAVAAAVASGESERGILPVENNHAGDTGARAVIANYRSQTPLSPGREETGLIILSQRWLPVRMHLLALPGTKLEDLTVIVSHSVALRQCARLIAELGLPTEKAPNTAIAARDLAGSAKAVLASEAAAAAYDLTILRRDVHDRPDNATLFAVLARGAR